MWSTLPLSPYLRVAYLRNSRAKYTKGYSSQWLVTQTSDSLIIIILHACLGLTTDKTIKQHYIYVLSMPPIQPSSSPLADASFSFFGGTEPLVRIAPGVPVLCWAQLPGSTLSVGSLLPDLFLSSCVSPGQDSCLFLKLYNIRIKFIHQVEDLARLQSFTSWSFPIMTESMLVGLTPTYGIIRK